jgi:hypothetical protein
MYLKHNPKPVSLQGEIDTASPEALFQQLDNKIKGLFDLFNLKTLLHRVAGSYRYPHDHEVCRYVIRTPNQSR